VPIVGFYHTDFPSAYVEPIILPILGKKSACIAKTLSSQYAKYIYNKCDVTIAPTEMFRKKLISYGIKRPVYIPLGVNTELFNPARHDKSIRERLDIEDDELMLIYSGRLDSEKRIDVLVKAFEKLPGALKAKFVVVGDGPYRKELESAQRRIKGLTVLPYIGDKIKLAYLLSAADIYVTAGPYETFGLSVLEAQASGLPVVGVKSGALLERVNPSIGILGEVDSPENMAENIVTLYHNGYLDKGKEARKMVEKKYSWDKTFNQLFDLYRSQISTI
jgi:alpha-1,6-mannosyltransferase